MLITIRRAIRHLRHSSPHMLWLLLLWAMLSKTYGQVIQTPSSEEQRRRVQLEAQERQRLVQQPKVELFEPRPTSPLGELDWPVEPSCFSLKKVTVQVSPQLSDQTKLIGASALPLDPFHFVQEYAQHIVGKCIGNHGLALLVQRATNLILQEGYSTTRVGLAEQDLSTGELTLTLVPGVIHAIRLSETSMDGTWRNAFPSGSGQLLNLRDLEQGLEQMKRVLSQDVEMHIVPAEVAGESDVVLTIQRRKAWKLSASLDNSGAKGTGQLQAGGNFSVDNLLGSDLLTIGINNDADRSSQRGTNGHHLSYSVPMGYWTYGLAASDYTYRQKIAGEKLYVSSGKSQNLDINVNYLFQRNQTQKNSVQFHIGKRWSRAFIDDVEIDVQKRHVTSIELAWIHKHYFGNAQLDLTLANRWGTSLFGGQRDVFSRSEDHPTFHYALQTVDATLSMPFDLAHRSLNYTATLRGQAASSRLYLSDQFSIGGRYTVRGFDGELTLTAERGFFLRNEIDTPIQTGIGNHAAYVGLDVGKVFGPSVQSLVGDKLAGATLGLRGAVRSVSYDVFSSWPIYRPEQFKTAIPTVGFSLAFQY